MPSRRGSTTLTLTTRRLAASLCLAAVVAADASDGGTGLAAAPPRHPNILYLVVDQLQADMLSCAGEHFVRTPAIDSLAADGVRFELAYCANPVCLPSRVAMMTGVLPSHFAIRSNDDNGGPMPRAALARSLGWLFERAGYATAYGGKTHWPRGMTPRAIGFEEYLTTDERDGLAKACARFIREKRERPFLLVASFINPHDICYLAIDAYTQAEHLPPAFPHSAVERATLAAALRLPAGVSRAEFFARLCPPLPANYAIPAFEPECVTRRYTEARPFREYVRRHWSDQEWRLHRWAYCQLTEQVDAEIGLVLQALRAGGLERDTLIVFSSDHGDMNGAHRLEHKSVLYDEAARVPFIVSYKGVTRPGLVDRTHLVSAGLDLIPTLCDYAGIAAPPGLQGRSVRPLAEGRAAGAWRGEVIVESQDGRMLRTGRYKYNLYDSGAHREQVLDLFRDPGEMVNLAEDPKYRYLVIDCRERLRRWVQATHDTLADTYLVKAGN
ncbi:MAG: sulfatase-like hydrolase/transferase [Verrucomicrobia bacterium]|nr:sulfatase-like hydrolase/transferase [Verrucomicrobiota bacterium]